MTMPNKPEPPMNSKVREAMAQTIQVTRIGRATDPKPENEVWFTTQMQDLFVLDLTEAEKAIRKAVAEDMLELVGEDVYTTRPSGGSNVWKAQDELKAELRQKIKEWSEADTQEQSNIKEK